MPFTMTQKILFKHCDPAGIVFYPRYFEMINDCVETFFDVELAHPFEELHQIGGVPTVRIETVFQAPSRHGDTLDITLECLRLGRSSLDLEFTSVCGQEVRFKSNSTLVCVDNSGKSNSWPAPLRQRLEQHLKEQNDVT